MIIKSIHIVGFGKLCDFSLDFSDGSNVVYGNNEDGKTTVMAFMKMMFYGTTTKQSEAFKNPRKRYKPLNGGAFGGSIIFNHKGIDYRLEREFKGSNSTDKITLYNLNLLKPVALKSADVGSEFFSLSADAFEKSVYVGNIGYEDPSSAGGEINSKLANITQTGDEDVSFDLIKKRLNNFKGIYTTPRKVGVLDTLKKQIAALKEEHFEALEDEKRKQDIAQNLENLKAQKQNLTARLNEYHDALKGFEASIKFESLKKQIETADKCNDYAKAIAKTEAELSKNGALPQKADIDLCFSLLAVLVSLKSKIQKLSTAHPSFDSSLNDEIAQKTKELEQIEAQLNLISGYKTSRITKALFIIFAVLMLSSAVGILTSVLFAIPCILFITSFLLLVFLDLKNKNKTKRKKSNLDGQKTELYAAIQDLRLKKLESDNSSLAVLDSLKEQEQAEFKKLVNVLSRFTDTTITDIDKASAVVESINKKTTILNEQKAQLAALTAIIDSDKLQADRAEFNELCELHLLPATKEDIDFVNEKISQTGSKISAINEQMANLSGVLSSAFTNKKTVSQIENQISQLIKTAEQYEKLTLASDIALEALEFAYGNLHSSFGDVLNKKVADILSRLTDGKYQKLGVSDSLNVSLDCSGFVDARQFSSGTLDQIYFSLRLGIAELICDDLGGLPLLLDDAFLQYDDIRMKNGFRFLANYKNQSIMFTCRKEFADFAKTLEGTNIINL